MRLLYARIGEAFSYTTGKKMVKFSEEEIVANIFERFAEQKIAILSPLVRGRKGHYRELFEEIRKKGFLKVRVDGEVKDLTPKMQVDRYKTHDIEVVIDRMKVEPDMRLRISQSVQQALKMGKELMFVSPEPTGKSKESQIVGYSRQLMCEDTGISYEEPSPNSFSFNSPYGACPDCKGLGLVYQIDMDLVIPDRSKSIAQGGIDPLGEAKDTHSYKKIEKFAKKNKISLKIPVEELTKEQLNLILFGNQDESLEVTMEFEAVDEWDDEDYEGIVNSVKRYFWGSKSESVRDWAEKYMVLKNCASCGGGRLKKESLWFKVDNRNIAEMSELNLQKLALVFDQIEDRLSNKQTIMETRNR
jgi:excinuclease ABC subunit A